MVLPYSSNKLIYLYSFQENFFTFEKQLKSIILIFLGVYSNTIYHNYILFTTQRKIFLQKSRYKSLYLQQIRIPNSNKQPAIFIDIKLLSLRFLRSNNKKVHYSNLKGNDMQKVDFFRYL